MRTLIIRIIRPEIAVKLIKTELTTAIFFGRLKQGSL